MRRFIRNITLIVVVSFLYSNVVWAGGLPTETLAQDAGRILTEIFASKEPGQVQKGFRRFFEIGQIDKGLVFSQIAKAVIPNIENKELLNVYKEILFAIFSEEFKTGYPRINKDDVKIIGVTASGEITLSRRDKEFTYYLSYVDNRLVVTERPNGRNGGTSGIGNTLAVFLLPLLTTLLFGTSCKAQDRPPDEPRVPAPQAQPQLPTPGVPAEVQALPSATAQLPSAREVISKLDAWLSRISKTRTGLPPSHIGDTSPVAVRHGFATGGFTYDLAHVALRYVRTGNYQEARKIILYFTSRFNRYTVQELQEKIDQSSNPTDRRTRVFGILRLLPSPSDGKIRKHIINCVDTSSPWDEGSGIIEWYTDGGPQSWLGMAAVQLLMFDPGLSSAERLELEKFVAELADTIMGLFSHENIVSAGPARQDIDGAPAREHLGHIENMWDHYSFLRQSADYFNSKNPQLAKLYREKAEGILRRLKEKGALAREGNTAYFWQGFSNGQINRQIPTDVQAWGIASVGPRKLNEVFGPGTAEGMLDWLIRHALVLIDYVRPDGYQVTTIGADFSDPFLPDIKAQRGGVKTQISDEWTAGFILAMDVAMDIMANYYQEAGKTSEAEDILAMADALRFFSLMRATETPDGMLYWEYSTVYGMPTGYGWNSPQAPGGSLSGNQMLFALAGINPFDHSNNSLASVARIKRLGAERGIELLLARMDPKHKFSKNPVIRPGQKPKKVKEPRIPFGSGKKQDAELKLMDPSVFKKVSFFSAIGEGAGTIHSSRDMIGVRTVADWNGAEVSFTNYLDLSQTPYLTFKVKASKGATKLRINVVDKAYLLAKDWTRPPAFVETDLTGDNAWHTITVNLNESGVDIKNIGAISFEVGTATAGNPIGAEIYIKDGTFVVGERTRRTEPKPSAPARTPPVVERPDTGIGKETVICSGRCPQNWGGVAFFKDGRWEISDDDYFEVKVEGSGEYILRLVGEGQSYDSANMYSQPLRMGKTYKIYFRDLQGWKENTIKQIGINVDVHPWGLPLNGGSVRSVTIKLVKGGHTQLIRPDKTRLANGVDRGYTDGKLARYEGSLGLLGPQRIERNPRTIFMPRNSLPRTKAWVGNELENAEAIISGRLVSLDGELDQIGNYIIPRRDIHISSRVGEINYEIIHSMGQSYFTVKVTKDGVTTEKKVFAMPVGEGKVLVTNKLWQLLQDRESVSKQLLSHENFEQADNEERIRLLDAATKSLQDMRDKEDFKKLCRKSGINLDVPDGHMGGEIMELVDEYQRGREAGIYQRFSDVLVSSLDATLLGARLGEILGVQVDVDDFTQKLVRPNNTTQIVLGMVDSGTIDLELVSRAFGAVESTNGNISTLGTDYTTKATLVLANTWAWENRKISELKDIIGEGLLDTLNNRLRRNGYEDIIENIRELLIKVRYELGRIAQIEGGKIRLSSPYLHTLIARIATMAGIQPQVLLEAYYNDLISGNAHTNKNKLISAAVENALVEVGVVNKKGTLSYESSVDTGLIETIRKIGVEIYRKNIPSTKEFKNPVDMALDVDRNRDPFGIIEDILLSSPFTGELNCSRDDLSGLVSLLELLNLNKVAQRIAYVLPDNLKTEKRLDTLVISLDHLFTVERVDPDTGAITIVPKALGVTEKIRQVLANGGNVKIVGNPKTLGMISEDKRDAAIEEAVEKYLGLKTSQVPALTIQVAELNNTIEGLKDPQNSAVITTETEAGELTGNNGAFVYIPQAGELLGDVITVVTSISLTPEGKFTEGSRQILIDYLRKQVPGIDKTDIWQGVLVSLEVFDNSHVLYFTLPAVVKFTDKLKELQLYRITVLIAA